VFWLSVDGDAVEVSDFSEVPEADPFEVVGADAPESFVPEAAVEFVVSDLSEVLEAAGPFEVFEGEDAPESFVPPEEPALVFEEVLLP